MKKWGLILFSVLVLLLLVGCEEGGKQLPPISESEEGETQIPPTNTTPRLIINTPDNNPITTKEWVNKAEKRGVSAFQIQEAGSYNTEILEMDIRGRGNSTWDMPKKPYNINLTKEEALFGMTTHRKWVLLANYADKTLLRTDFALGLGREVFTDLGWTSDLRSVELVLNGKYQGVYQLVEKIEIAENRLDITVKGDGATDFLLERDHREKDEEYKFTTEKGLRLSWEKTVKDVATSNTPRIIAIQERVQEIENLLFSYTDIAELENDIDLPSFIDWYLINELTKNVDAQQYSSIFLYQKNDKLYMGPLWDFDLSSGNANYHTCDDPEGFYVYDEKSAWYYQLFQDPAFVTMVQARWNEKKELVLAHIDQIADKASELEEAQQNNFNRWKILGKYVWPNPVWPDTYQGEIDNLIEWITTRYYWFDEHLNALPSDKK